MSLSKDALYDILASKDEIFDQLTSSIEQRERILRVSCHIQPRRF
jgi:hypothetical protein